MNWYYLDGEKKAGPFSEATMLELRACGILSDETQIQREGAEEWGCYRDLFQALTSNPHIPVVFKFACPHCQQNISAEEDYSGKNVQCPTCGVDFVVPLLLSAARRIEEEIKVSSAPHPQPLGQNALKQPAYQAPQMKTPTGVKTPAGRRKGKGMLIGVLVAAAIVMIGGVFLVLSSRAEKRQMTKNIYATTRTKPGIKSEKIKDAGAKNIDAATRTKPFVNSLGMKFVPVPIKGGKTDGQSVLFCVWETRHKDFKAFVDATGYDATKKKDGKVMAIHWADCSWEITPDHPVSLLNGQDGEAFCKWLTKIEKEKGVIKGNQKYRLPTDHEWSCAAGIGEDENAEETPKEKIGKIKKFSWGYDFPPPMNHENTGGVADGYKHTAPVGSFKPNKNGLYDMGGNNSEVCTYTDKNEKLFDVTRGPNCWPDLNPKFKEYYYLSHRLVWDGESPRGLEHGFRCVLVSE